jgi:hypothetical protein
VWWFTLGTPALGRLRQEDLSSNQLGIHKNKNKK